MKLGVIQSNYIPWRGYFDFIGSVDSFIIYDDVQFSKGSWRNRNKLKCGGDTKWITLPVKVRLGMKINEVEINNTKDWKREHRELIQKSLVKKPFFKQALEVWETGIDVRTESLSELNEHLIRTICRFLGINTTIERSESYLLTGTKTDRLMDLFNKTGCTSYLSGPAAESYLELDKFKANNIELRYKSYDYETYNQNDNTPFEGEVTILDLIANTGIDAAKYCVSKTADKIIVTRTEHESAPGNR